MKKLFLFAAAAILSISSTAMADVKIKSRQTSSGQSSENTTYIKGKRQRTEMLNGQMISITQCDLNRDLQLNSATKTYMINFYDDGTTVSQPTAVKSETTTTPVTKGGTMFITTTIKDTGERKQMFGFTARHIITTIETDSSADSCTPNKSKMEMDMWVIDAEFYLQCTQNRQYRPTADGRNGGCRDKIEQKTIGTAKSGYPLYSKMTGYDANGKETFTMINEVIELSKATLDQSLFEAPADYRQVKDAAEMYAVSNPFSSDSGMNSGSSGSASSGMTSSIKSAATPKTDTATAPIGPKKPGTIRVGLADVKVGSVGEGINGTDLSAAIENSLGDYLKGTKVEVVSIENKLASAMVDEAKQKECDFVVITNAAHKKGGGGFGGFGKVLAQTVAQTGIGHTGSTAGNVAGQIATQGIVTAATMNENVKKKDEITLDLKVQSTTDNSQVLAKQFKAKATADGDDIISTVVEQAAQAIVDTVGK